MALNLKEIIEGMSGKRVRQILNENMQATVDEAAAVAAVVGTIRGEVDGLTSKVARFMGSVVKAEDANQIGVWYVMGQTGYPGGVLAYSKAMGTQTVTQTLISPSSPIYDASGAIYAWEAKPCILVRQLLNGGWSTWQIVGEDRLKDVESKVGEIALKITEVKKNVITDDAEEMRLETDGGQFIGKATSSYAHFAKLMVGAEGSPKEVATKEQVDTLKTSIDSEIAKKQNALKQGKNIIIEPDGTISAEGGIGDLPIEKDAPSDSSDTIVVKSDDDRDTYIEVGEKNGKKGIFVPAIYDLDGNPLMGIEIDRTNNVMRIGGNLYRLIPYFGETTL